jgi:uncharacterized membrane protein
MDAKAVITVSGTLEEVQRRWQDAGYRSTYIEGVDAQVAFRPAPGDRGTEIHVTLRSNPPGGKLGEAAAKLTGALPRAKVKDELRRFKQRVETGEVARSDATPEGEAAEAKLKQRPAQPLSDKELETVGAR